MRGRFREPTWQLLGVTLIASFSAYIGYNLVFEQFQGRYLFTAIVPIGVLLVAGVTAWAPWRWRARAGLSLGLVLIAINAYTLFRVLVPGFAPTG